jgi:hypothetical protein
MSPVKFAEAVIIGIRNVPNVAFLGSGTATTPQKMKRTSGEESQATN